MSKRAQWTQVADAYSTSVTGALGSPRSMSPSAEDAEPPVLPEQAVRRPNDIAATTRLRTRVFIWASLEKVNESLKRDSEP